MKYCSKCEQIKILDDFGKNKNKKDGLNIWCKCCVNKNYNKDKRKIYRDKNKHKNKEWRLNNIIHKKEYDKKYSDLNKNYKNNYGLLYRKNKYKNDPLYKLKQLINSSINHSLKTKNFHKTLRSTEIIGCSIKVLKEYFESKFEPWMNWGNHGLYNGEKDYGWDIDHIIPISSGSTEEEILKLNHFSNLQPLCSKINRDIKKNKI